MTPRPKTAIAVTLASVLAALLFASVHTRSVRAFFRQRLAAPSRGLASRPPALRGTSLPGIVLWAWERPEDLRFLTSGRAAVAFLAETIYLQGPPDDSSSIALTTFSVRPRLQPLRFASRAQLIAVVRIERQFTPQREVAPLKEANFAARLSHAATFRESLASEISRLQSIPGVAAIQIDFDATTSEHPFYSALLQDVRRKLPNAMPLSITALASWCIGDRWLTQLPRDTIDEAVPMLFRMGPDSGNVARFVRSGDDFPVPACRGSLGLSTDEPLSQILLSSKPPGISSGLQGKRVYVFSPSAWTETVVQKILVELQP